MVGTIGPLGDDAFHGAPTGVVQYVFALALDVVAVSHKVVVVGVYREQDAGQGLFALYQWGLCQVVAFQIRNVEYVIRE